MRSALLIRQKSRKEDDTMTDDKRERVIVPEKVTGKIITADIAVTLVGLFNMLEVPLDTWTPFMMKNYHKGVKKVYAFLKKSE